MSFEVRFSAQARADLLRLHAHMLKRAEVLEDLLLAERAIDEIQLSCEAQLRQTPFLFRKASSRPTRRELVIPFGAAGYVVLYEITGTLVLILAVRHQLEGDYH